MTRLPILFAALLALDAPLLRAQASPPRPQHIGHEELRAAVTPADATPARPMIGKLVCDRGNYTCIALRRTATGEPELHEEWNDVMLIQAGSGTLLVGGELQGARSSAPGELRGGEIRGGERQQLAAGDMMIVPAGTPHQVEVAPGESITYLVVKVRRSAPEESK
jgi:mannose-6-phosphate isomerase-like protein (cupin superfamily)